MLLLPVVASADEVEIDGILYDIIRGTNANVKAKSPKYTGDIVIPASVTYNGVECAVTGIEYGAFMNCSGLTSVTIPSSVTSIESHAFYFCSDLTAVTIPSSVKTIEQNTFDGCSSLTSVVAQVSPQ